MAPVMKVVMRWESEDAPEQKTVLKLKLPRKWKDGPTLNLKQCFLDSFNGKHPDSALEASEVHLENKSGDAFADQDVVIRVLKSGEDVFVRPGAPPTELFNPVPDGEPGSEASSSAEVAASETAAGGSVSSSKTAPRSTPVIASGVSAKNPHHVASKAALEAEQKRQLSFDYSKWDRLDLSDDDGEDCHPNIDKESWKRLKAQQRRDRREKEDEKLAKLDAKIDKYEKRVKQVQAAIDRGVSAEDGGERDTDQDAQLMVDLREAQSNAARYRAKKEQFLRSRKLIADDLCAVREDSSNIVQEAPKPMMPQAPVDEAKSYESFVANHEPLLRKFASLKDDQESEEMILAHPGVLLDTHAEGFLLLLCLDACMRHKDPSAQAIPVSEETAKQHATEERRIAKQHLLVHYILELAKGMKREPIEAVVPFFRKASKRSPEQVAGFEEDLDAFVARLRKRADDKIANNEVSPLADDPNEGRGDVEVIDDEEYEPAGVGPGGLDPNEVLNSLPEEMAEAFVEQDTPRLKRALASMPPEEAEYHMKRCIDSGLWVAQA